MLAIDKFHTACHVLRILILVLSFSLLLACDDEDRLTDNIILDKMEFFNSTREELDSIKIFAYKQGSNFKKLKDSSYSILEFEKLENSYYLDFYGYLNKDLNPDLDYRILFLSNGDTCDITNIEIVKYGTIFTGYSRQFDGYYVNGNEFACQIIKVFPKHNYH